MRPRKFPVSILAGMSMEIPQRVLVQNLFVVFGLANEVIGIPLAVILTAIIWAQFIAIQALIEKEPINRSLLLEIIASVWFSIWIGILYTLIGNILVIMLTHALEKSVVHGMRNLYSRAKTY